MLNNSNQRYFIENGYEDRCLSTIKLIRSTIDKFKIRKQIEFIVNVDDSPYDIGSAKTFKYSTTTQNFNETFPDFNYDCYRHVGYKDYEDVRSLINKIDVTPETNKIGWIGAGTDSITPRKILYKLGQSNTDTLDIRSNIWDRINTDCIIGGQYLNYEEQIKKWKYLIDVEGVGYSGRLKYLLSSKRIVFIVSRPWYEWFYRYLKPWENFIPVKRDLSDLLINYERIEKDKELQKYIIHNQRKLDNICLSRDSALVEINRLIQTI